VHGTDLYVGTESVNVAGINKADHVVRWSGTAWHAVGANDAGTDGWFPASSFIYGLTTQGSRVFATGSFQNADGRATADEVAVFDGTSWAPIGSDGNGNGPLSQQGTSLAVFEGSLVDGGSFINAGGDTLADSIAGFLLKRPDARSSTAVGGPYLGNNVYSGIGAGETRTISIARGHSATLYVDIQNDGIVPASFDVHATGTSAGHSVNYFHGATNVTSQVKTDTYTTASLGHAAHETLKMVITLSASAAAHATYVIDATTFPFFVHDQVRIVVNAQ
jgi:hypothetical protein